MSFQSPGPEILSFGPITLRWYGLLIATGFYLALNYGTWLVKKRSAIARNEAAKQLQGLVTNDDEIGTPSGLAMTDGEIDDFQNFAFISLFGGIVGARAWFVVLDWDYFSQHLIEAPQIWLGGISIQGGIIGGVLTALIFYGKDIRKMLFYLSALASAIPLAQSIGRWGNFFNEEAFGKVCDLPWKLFISHTGQYHHPTFLYESILNLFIFGILFIYNKFFYKNETKYDLRLIGLYFFLYSFIRFFLEGIRTDSLLIAGYPAAQILALAGMSIGVIVIARSSSAATRQSHGK